MRTSTHTQRGMTLIISLIMLLLVTMLVVSSFNLGKNSLQTVGNMQQRNDNYKAAQETLEEVISGSTFYTSPNSTISTPCNSAANTKCVDINGDGTSDVTVVITPAPSCVKAQIIKTDALNLSIQEDADCSVGQPQVFGMAGASTGNSLCANSLWEIRAEASDNVTQAKVVAANGVSVRVPKDSVDTSCP